MLKDRRKDATFLNERINITVEVLPIYIQKEDIKRKEYKVQKERK